MTAKYRLPGEHELPYSDGEPMESQRHADQLQLLSLPLREYCKERTDFFVGTDMFVYFSPVQVKSHDFKGPDVFVVLGVKKRERLSYVLWEENNHAPNVIIELLSHDHNLIFEPRRCLVRK